MEQSPPKTNQNIINSDNDISPISKMKIDAANKSKKESQYWIEHYKYKQNLRNKLELLKNEKSEKSSKISQISTFDKEQEILCDNLFKLTKLTNYSQNTLGQNFDQMKKFENNEEMQKNKLKNIFQNNLNKIKQIEKTSEDLEEQKKILKTWFENVEKMKNNISNLRNENCINIDSLCIEYAQKDKELKKISKIYNLLCNITKYRILDIKNDEKDNQCQNIVGYLLNVKNGNIMNYNIKMVKNESVENKALKVMNFWNTLIDFNKNDTL